MSAAKLAWQRNSRAQFAKEHGYSTTAHYSTGGLRDAVLERDGYQCVRCGMTDRQHRALWNRPITVDHKDKKRIHNTLENLQILCLRCHGRKDISASLIVSKTHPLKRPILAMRERGATYQEIATKHNLSIGAVWKWCQRWTKETA